MKGRARVAILGAGQVGLVHARALSQLDAEVEVIGIADVDIAKAETIAREIASEAFHDYRDLLSRAPDVSVVCLPHALHREACMEAASVGSHLLVEKPFATSAADAREIVAACAQARVQVGVGYVHRYRQEFKLARELLTRGVVGDVISANDRYGLSGDSSVPDWVWSSGGGTLLYSGAHSIDWLRWLVGSDVVAVFGSVTEARENGGERQQPREAFASILRFANGCIAALVANQPAYNVSPRTRDTELYGTRGRIRLRLGEGLDVTTNEGAYEIRITRDDPFVAQARHFIDAIAQERPPPVSGADGIKVLEIVEAIRTSCVENRVVQMEPRVAGIVMGAQS